MFGRLTYGVLELVWALPVLALQWAVGCRWLARSWRLLLVCTLAPTVYLGIADSVALRLGIWTLHPARTTGILIGPLPVEEAVFFLATNLMIVQTVILLRQEPVKEWTRPWLDRFRSLLTRRPNPVAMRRR